MIKNPTAYLSQQLGFNYSLVFCRGLFGIEHRKIEVAFHNSYYFRSDGKQNVWTLVLDNNHFDSHDYIWDLEHDMIVDQAEQHTAYGFIIPDDFQHDYQLLTQGKYSQTSDAYSERIIAHARITENISESGLLWLRHAFWPGRGAILYLAWALGVDPDMITEIVSKPDEKEECFILNKLHELNSKEIYQ